MLNTRNWTFLRAWLSNPRRVGAVAPSSPELATSLASAIDPASTSPVLELGPGTGVVTQAILDRGLPPEQLIALERSDLFAQTLRTRFPEIKVLKGDAFAVKDLAAKDAWPGLGGVVSSLPLLTTSVAARIRLYEDLFDLLEPGAPLVQFSYMRSPPVPDRSTCFKALPHAYITRNMPPARVWVYRRRQDFSGTVAECERTDLSESLPRQA